MFSFDLDLNGDGYLKLTFSETVNSTSLDISKISLQNADNTSSVTLQGGSKTSENSHIITVSFSTADLNYIKFQTNLATHMYDTFLYLFTSELTDMNSNILLFSDSAIMVRDLIFDITSPSLQSFDLDFSNNSLLLSFSEVINASSLDLSFFLFIGNQSNPLHSQQFMLSGGSKSGPSILSGHPPIIIIYLLNNDTNNIKKLDMLALDNTSTFLTVSPDAAFDYSNNVLNPISIFSSLPVRNFVPDSVNPILLTFTLNMDNGILTLIFSETVQSNSLRLSDLSIKDTKTLINGSYFLLDSLPSNIINEPVLNILLGNKDLNYIKLNPKLCTQITNCFISFNSTLIHDTSGNNIAQINPTQAKSVSIFYSDLTSPSLLHAELDMDNSNLLLQFDEPVDVISLNFTQISIQSIPGILTEYSDFETLNNSTSISNNGQLVEVLFGANNLFSIQRNLQLATNSSNSYLSYSSLFIQDMNHNYVNSVSQQNATLLSIIPDTSGPILQNFSLNINTGSLNLTFDEVINGQSLSAGLIILSSNVLFESSVEFISLSPDTYINRIIDTHIGLSILKEDLDILKLSSFIATNLANSYLTLEENCVEDTAYPGNILV